MVLRSNFYFRQTSSIRQFVVLLSLSVIPCLSPVSDAGTIVRVSTSVGDYSIELLDDSAPATVQNFLNYVNRGDFNATYLHRVPNDFVVQGGAYRFQPYVGPVDVVTDLPVANEFGASNTKGTVAMAKIDGDPDSATNQWFVNLNDNTSLDATNGGFTVFGNVLGNGMAVLDTIDSLPKINLGFKAQDAPFISGAYNDPRDLVYMNVSVVERYSEAAHVFESSTGLLITSVNVNNDEDIVSLYLHAVSHSSGFQFKADLDTVIPRTDFTGIATFSSTENRLLIPSLEVNQGDKVIVLTNVLFSLTDPDALIFTLVSYE
ncbi:MAG TPA: peptidylprolyl isomerase [Gammaproteobacteria bacterium]|nr:peptidylprolyl isomerase [Gammaproteobacteria bacterium]